MASISFTSRLCILYSCSFLPKDSFNILYVSNVFGTSIKSQLRTIILIDFFIDATQTIHRIIHRELLYFRFPYIISFIKIVCNPTYIYFHKMRFAAGYCCIIRLSYLVTKIMWCESYICYGRYYVFLLLLKRKLNRVLTWKLVWSLIMRCECVSKALYNSYCSAISSFCFILWYAVYVGYCYVCVCV